MGKIIKTHIFFKLINGKGTELTNKYIMEGNYSNGEIIKDEDYFIYEFNYD